MNCGVNYILKSFSNMIRLTHIAEKTAGELKWPWSTLTNIFYKKVYKIYHFTDISIRCPHHQSLVSLRLYSFLSHLASGPIFLIVTPNHTLQHLSSFSLLRSRHLYFITNITENSFPKKHSFCHLSRVFLFWKLIHHRKTSK